MQNDILTTLKLAGLVLAIFLAFLFKGLLVQAPKVDAHHAFNTERAFERLTRILGDEAPHPVDSAANDAVISRLVTEIEALGFTPIIRDEFHCVESRRSGRCARLQNVAFWVTAPGPNAVMLLSHHDSVPAGPGASDDGAGMTASLEIASLLKSEPQSRPLLVLITDGEELGLMGANLFVTKDPLAQMVGAVVNMEARGVRGPTAFFQTSTPNSNDLKALYGTTRLPIANSLSADIYELLPNDTDLTEFLHLPIDAANLAYTDGVAFYHTPGDNLANMDKRALFHLGASGLAATRTFLNQTGSECEVQILYTDILGLFTITLTPLMALLILIFGALAALLLLRRASETAPVARVFFIPPLALLTGVGLSMIATLLVDIVRPEQLFGFAHPIALRGLHASAGLTGALIIYTFMTGPRQIKALLASAWLWTVILGLVIFFNVQGGAILFAPPLAIFSIASLVLWLEQRTLGLVIAALGAVLSAVILLPVGAAGESNLFIESAAPFAFIPVLLFLYTVPLVWPKYSARLRSFWLTLIGAGFTMAVFLSASIMVPAYSPDAPRALSISHLQSDSFENPVWSIFGSDAPPDTLLATAPFKAGTLPIFAGQRHIAPAPGFATNLAASITSDVTTNDTRTITLEASASEMDRVFVSFETDTHMGAITLNGQSFTAPEDLTNLVCSGRACRNLQVSLSFPASSAPPIIDLTSLQFGLGPEGAALLAARPDWTIPRQRGDARYTHVRLTPDL